MEDVAGIDFVFYVVQAGVVAVGNDGLGKRLELLQVVDNQRAEERAAVGQGWFVDDDLCALGFDTLHNALYRRLTEIV